MLSYYQASILGLVQGITELFPVSSLGHSVILPSILGWNIDQNNNFFVVFLVATHFATALALFGFFFKDWILILKGVWRSVKNWKIDVADKYAKIGWLLIIGTVPAGIVGLVLQKKLTELFAAPLDVAIFLILNGFLLYGTELLRKRKKETTEKHNDKQLAKISYPQSLKIGLAQCLALIPGFSRTGSTISGGLLVGLNHEDAARFSFLLATPIIFAAAILKLPDLTRSTSINTVGPIFVGSVTALIAAYFSTHFLIKYFENKKLTPFAIYCVVIGIGASLLFLIK